MKIHGINGLTLLDYPGKMACTIFTGHCNFRCPFCHNATLVLNPDSQPLISEEAVFELLAKREGRLEGVAITGGEPTLNKDLPEHTKLVAEALGIDCPKGIYLPLGAEIPEELPAEFPLIVKPNAEGYSMGVFLAKDREELRSAVQYNYDNYKDGSDIDIVSLNDKCFTTIRDEIPDLSPKAAEDIRKASLLLYRHMECADFGRCDFKLTDDDRAVLIEINPRPGLTKGGPFENCATPPRR